MLQKDHNGYGFFFIPDQDVTQISRILVAKMDKAIFKSSIILCLLLFSAGSAWAVQRMGLVAGSTGVIPPWQSGTLSSRCLDEHESAPTKGDSFTQMLSGNADDITVTIGDSPPIPFDQAIREGKIEVTGYSPLGGDDGGYNRRTFIISQVVVNNLTDKPVTVRVKRFTPIGTFAHTPFGYDVSRLAGLSQNDLWDTQPKLAEEEERRRLALKAEEEVRRLTLVLDDAFHLMDLEAEKAKAERRRWEERAKDAWKKMTFVSIPVGSFTMGSPKKEADRNSDEKQHKVIISRSFLLQTTEVTQSQWFSVMGSNPSSISSGNGEDNPVQYVSWNDIQEFIRKLNELDPGMNYRLPTEAEWEYACRAGATEDRYGNLNVIAWYWENSNRQTQPAGQKQPNAWGLYDMLGNVREWCADWYGDYPKDNVTDPAGPSGGSDRVIRGGSWDFGTSVCRSANRQRGKPGIGSNDLGFRLARSIESGKDKL